MKIALRQLPRIGRRAGLVGVVSLAACAVGAGFDRTAFFQAWLVTWLFLVGIALAAMAQIMIHELTGGEWGLVLRPPLEAAASTLPLLALFAIPLAFGLTDLFAWARAEVVAHSEVLRAKRWYLNEPAFIARNALWFFVWGVLARALRRHLDQRADARDPANARRIAIAGLLVYLFTVTFFAVDWIASLTPEWFSAAIGIRLGAAQFVAAFAFAVPFAVLCARTRPTWPCATPRDFQDLGNLLLTFTMTWAYFAFAQYLIVWGEDLPHETSWYWPRTETSWRYLALAIVVLNFALPVIAMLFREVKRSAAALATVCGLILVGQWLDALWLIAPSVRPEGFALSWLDFAALVAQGGLWLAVVAVLVERVPLRAPAKSERVAAHG